MVTLINCPPQAFPTTCLFHRAMQRTRCVLSSLNLDQCYFHLASMNCDKLESLKKCIFRFIFKDTLSSFDDLAVKESKDSILIHWKASQNSNGSFQELTFFCVSSRYLKELFVYHSSSYPLTGKNILTLPLPRTTNYGLECIRYQAAKIWNSLPGSVRTITFFYKDFKTAIKKMSF